MQRRADHQPLKQYEHAKRRGPMNGSSVWCAPWRVGEPCGKWCQEVTSKVCLSTSQSRIIHEILIFVNVAISTTCVWESLMVTLDLAAEFSPLFAFVYFHAESLGLVGTGPMCRGQHFHPLEPGLYTNEYYSVLPGT